MSGNENVLGKGEKGGKDSLNQIVSERREGKTTRTDSSGQVDGKGK